MSMLGAYASYNEETGFNEYCPGEVFVRNTKEHTPFKNKSFYFFIRCLKITKKFRWCYLPGK